MTLIDLSGPLFNGMWSYNRLSSIQGQLPEFSVEKATTIAKDGSETFRLIMSSLSGTYLETGGHMIEGVPPLSDLDCKAFTRPAVVCHLPRKQAHELICGEELAAACPPLRDGDALLVECGWASRWRSPDFVTGGPGFHSDCQPWLMAQPISLLGVDVPCMEAPWTAPGTPESGSGMLLNLFHKGILLLAPLVNLDTVTVTRGQLTALPLNVTGASGAPCRAVFAPLAESAPSRDLRSGIAACVDDFFARRQDLTPVREDLLRAYDAIARSLQAGGTLFLCGNGGSFADALHISGELLKSYERARPLPHQLRSRLQTLPGGERLAAHLQSGMRAIVLGANGALASAVQNDFAVDRLGYAQELLALARPGDVLLGISTSGNAENVLHAVLTARALDMSTLALTGEDGGHIAPVADVAVRVPAHGARAVQELHQPLYHLLCSLLELHFYSS